MERSKFEDNYHIDKVLKGDKQAFRYFIKEYKDISYHLAISIVKSSDNAEDVVQESFIKVFKSLKSFKKDAKFSSWLYRIVVNESYMFLRKNRISFLEIDDLIVEFPLEQVEDNQQLELARKMILCLNSNEATVLNLFYLEEKKIKEIAEITGWSISNVKVLLHRARKNVKKLLSKEL